jgi:hypothetical protein
LLGIGSLNRSMNQTQPLSWLGGLRPTSRPMLAARQPDLDGAASKSRPRKRGLASAATLDRGAIDRVFQRDDSICTSRGPRAFALSGHATTGYRHEIPMHGAAAMISDRAA